MTQTLPFPQQQNNVSSNTTTTNKKNKDDELIRLALHRSSFFTCMDEEQIERFIDVAELKTFKDGQIIIQEGNRFDYEPSVSFSSAGKVTSSSIVSKEEEVDDNNDERQTLIIDEGINGDILSSPSPSVKDEWEQCGGDIGGRNINSHTTTITGEYSNVTEQQYGTNNIYVIKENSVNVSHQGFNVASLGPGTVFGEGAILFNRSHSASVIAKGDETICWIVPAKIFREHVLPSKNMLDMFTKYVDVSTSNKDRPSEIFITMDNCIRSLSEFNEKGSFIKSVKSIDAYNILKTSQHQGDSKIGLTDFCIFHLLKARPDPEIDIAFLLMDRNKRGFINLEDFKAFTIGQNEIIANDNFRFNTDSDFSKRYFRDGQCVIQHVLFSQFFMDYQKELGLQIFLDSLHEHGNDGRILSRKKFLNVLKLAFGCRLPEGIIDRLNSVYCCKPIEAAEAVAQLAITSSKLKKANTGQTADFTKSSILSNLENRSKQLGQHVFGYSDFVAYQEVFNHLPTISNIIHRSCEIKEGPISCDDLKVASKILGGGQLSRQQVDIIFLLFDLNHDGFISSEDASSVIGSYQLPELEAVPGRKGHRTFSPPPTLEINQKMENKEIKVTTSVKEATQHVSECIEMFILSGIAGAISAVVVYPIDLIKTRMQCQRIMLNKRRLYKNSIDCFFKTLRSERPIGLFAGLTPQLVGITPEKVIKFTVHDMLYKSFKNLNGEGEQKERNLRLFEVISGACSGACQVLVTNPMEIIKIRLQVQGETIKQFVTVDKTLLVPRSAIDIIKELGLVGLYKGAASCLLRDIPFSAILFPVFSITKDFLKIKEGSTDLSISNLLISGSVAGTSDTIKTRLQVIPRDGECAYLGIYDCAAKIYQQEGITAFFKGTTMRVLRSAPQFAITLFAYENLRLSLGLGHMPPPIYVPIDSRDYKAASVSFENLSLKWNFLRWTSSNNS